MKSRTVMDIWAVFPTLFIGFGILLLTFLPFSMKINIIMVVVLIAIAFIILIKITLFDPKKKDEKETGEQFD